jgi:hypothetical protein
LKERKLRKTSTHYIDSSKKFQNRVYCELSVIQSVLGRNSSEKLSSQSLKSRDNKTRDRKPTPKFGQSPLLSLRKSLSADLLLVRGLSRPSTKRNNPNIVTKIKKTSSTDKQFDQALIAHHNTVKLIAEAEQVNIPHYSTTNVCL